MKIFNVIKTFVLDERQWFTVNNESIIMDEFQVIKDSKLNLFVRYKNHAETTNEFTIESLPTFEKKTKINVFKVISEFL